MPSTAVKKLGGANETNHQPRSPTSGKGFLLVVEVRARGALQSSRPQLPGFRRRDVSTAAAVRDKQPRSCCRSPTSPSHETPSTAPPQPPPRKASVLHQQSDPSTTRDDKGGRGGVLYFPKSCIVELRVFQVSFRAEARHSQSRNSPRNLSRNFSHKKAQKAQNRRRTIAEDYSLNIALLYFLLFLLCFLCLFVARSHLTMAQHSPEQSAKTRIETDSMGAVEVPADRYWGLRRSARFIISISATTACRAR